MKKLLIVIVLCLLLSIPANGVAAAPGITLDNTRWVEYPTNPVFDPVERAYYPCIIYDDGVYKMWYDYDPLGGIAFAISHDGISWTKVADCTGLRNARHSWVTKTDKGYEIWYWDTAELLSINAIRHAVSLDGINWTNDAAITQDPAQKVITGIHPDWNYGSYGPHCVLFNPAITVLDKINIMNNRYVMYYDGTNGGDTFIGVAGSVDGKHWVGNPTGKPVLDHPPSAAGPNYVYRCTVLKEGSVYRMWFSHGVAYWYEGISYAESTDGINWKEDPNNPIFHITDGVAWRAARTYTPLVLKVGSTYKMWFSGVAAGNYAIGYAYIPVAPTVTTEPATNMTTTGARLNGNLTSLGTATTVNVSFQWGISPGVYPNETTPKAMTATGTFSFDLTGLTAGTTYYFRAKADGGIHGISYGGEKSFTTVAAGPPQSTPTATNTGTASFLPSLGNITNLTAVAEHTLPVAGKPTGVTFPHGLFSFNITNIAPGSTVTVIITFPLPLPVGTKYWKYQAGIGWFQIPMGSDDGDNVITIQLTDGGLGDADRVVNGTIVDPGGPAVPVPLPPPKPRLALTPATLFVSDLSLVPTQVYPNQPVVASVYVTNRGDIPGSITLNLIINGRIEQSQSITVPGRGVHRVTFIVYKAEPGIYKVAIDGLEGYFTVIGESSLTGSGQDISMALIIGIVLVFIALFLALLALLRRRAY